MATDVESYVRFALGLRGAVEVAALQTRYRSPLLEGARALSKAQAAAVEAVEASVSLAKAVLVEGDGGVAPRDGDLVELHLTLRSADDEERVLSSTRAAEGGRGAPAHALLGAACSLLRGVELALGAFSSGERAVLRVPPELAYGEQARGRGGVE